MARFTLPRDLYHGKGALEALKTFTGKKAIVCVGGGFVYGSLGMSHHATEDMAIMRALPGVTVFTPGDPAEVEAIVPVMLKTPGTCYLRLGRGGEPTLHDLGPLAAALHARGHEVVLETNGTQEVPVEWGIDWIAVSPKPDAAYVVICHADELKYVVDENLQVEHIQDALVPEGRVYLQVEGGRPASALRAMVVVE